MNKSVKIIRGGQHEPLIAKYTAFDSIIEVNDTDSNRLLYTVPYAVTQPYNGYQGGIVAEDLYGFVCGSGMQMPSPQEKVLYWFRKEFIGKVHGVADLTEAMRTFTSLRPNPNHGGALLITDVLVHNDNTQYPCNGGYSDGCTTIFPGLVEPWQYLKSFFDLFNIGDTGTILLIRDPAWKMPG